MSKAKYPNKPIPRKIFQDGIDLCKRNIRDFLTDAQLIIAQGRLNHAYIMVEFAIEELGKIVMLKEAFSSDLNDPVTVEGDVFGTHKGKSEKAWTVLDINCRTIFDEGLFDHELFDPDLFDTDTLASHKTRLNCAFVDFKGDCWTLGERIKQELLEKLINHINEAIRKI